MKIGFLPIDNRPVCYTLPKQICEIDKDIDIIMPNREFLGDLISYANIQELFNWLENLPKVDALVISLDTIAYGGLIPSRRLSNSFDVVKDRIFQLKNILLNLKTKIYAFSSIMRISNNNINEEEKLYWSEYGKKIFQYSFEKHKYGTTSINDIPQDILNDYLQTRKRNFDINKIYLQWKKEGLFDTLIFSKDDCAEFGLNVIEANQLKSAGAFVKTGADEIPLLLLSKSINGSVKIAPIFFEPQSKNLISNYEDIPIEECVKNQIELTGCTISSEKEADILLYINNFVENQGEIVMKRTTKPFNHQWILPDKSFAVADVRFANGSDNAFIDKLFETDFYNDNFYGYSAWNTSANTLGSLVAAAKIKFLAKKYNEDKFKQLQVIRFLDDWAYQANVRQKDVNINNIKSFMSDYEKNIFAKLDYYPVVNYNFPWNRLFEVEVKIESD